MEYKVGTYVLYEPNGCMGKVVSVPGASNTSYMVLWSVQPSTESDGVINSWDYMPTQFRIATQAEVALYWREPKKPIRQGC